jgi:hypothetical protein
MAGLLWLVWADVGLPLDSLPRLGVEKIHVGLIALMVRCCDPSAIALAG